MQSNAQSLGECVGQHLQAIVERKFRGAVLGHLAALLAFARAKDLAFDERAIACFELRELWEGLSYRKLMRIACIYAGDQRVNGLIEKLLPKAALHEFGNTLF